MLSLCEENPRTDRHESPVGLRIVVAAFHQSPKIEGVGVHDSCASLAILFSARSADQYQRPRYEQRERSPRRR